MNKYRSTEGAFLYPRVRGSCCRRQLTHGSLHLPLGLKAPQRPVIPRHTSTVSGRPLTPYFCLSSLSSSFLHFLLQILTSTDKCFDCLIYSVGAEACEDTWMDGLMDEEKIGWMNRWVSRERGISFHMTLYARGPEPLPLSLSYPRQAVSATGLVVLAPLGHSGIPPCHAAPTPPPPTPPHPPPPPSGCLLPS